MSFMRILSRSPDTELKTHEAKAMMTNLGGIRPASAAEGETCTSSDASSGSESEDEEAIDSVAVTDLRPVILNLSARSPKTTRASPSIWFHMRTSWKTITPKP